MNGQEKAIEDRLITNIEKSLSGIVGEETKRAMALDDFLKFQKALAIKTFSENLGRDSGLTAELVLSTINGN